MFTAHRINTVAELLKIPEYYGIEIDLRDTTNGKLHLSHDPFVLGEYFEDFIKYYHHKFIILNIKSERIEHKILDILDKHNITEYFFLDSSFPMIYLLSKSGNKNIAVRFSEYESIESILLLRNRVNWVWVDCFSMLPLTVDIYHTLREAGFKICIVSPELQGQDNKIEQYRDFMRENNIYVDMICTKVYNIPRWRQQVQIVVPMSGDGQRFIDGGYHEPKPLIIVDEKPMIQHVINLFPGEKSFTFICNRKHTMKHTMMIQTLHTLVQDPICYEIEKGRGPVEALRAAYTSICNDQEVIVSYCDYGTRYDYDKFLLDARRNDADGLIACYIGFHPHMLGKDHYAYARTDGVQLLEIREKQPFTENKMSEYASNGTYYFRTGALLKYYADKLICSGRTINDEYYVSMIYNYMVEDGLNVRVYEIQNMLQWGTPYDLRWYQSWSDYFRNKKTNGSLTPLNYTMIVPLAGKGSRFKGYNLPKPLLPVDGKPMVVAATECLPSAQDYIFICLEEHDKQYDVGNTLKAYFRDASVVTIPRVTEGQACTCEVAVNKLDPDTPIMITACDNGCEYDTERFQSLLHDDSIDVIVCVFNNHPSSINNPNMYAWVKTDTDNVLHVSCKKYIEGTHRKDSYVIEGTMFFRKAHFFSDGLRENYKAGIMTNNEYYVDDIINQNVKMGLKVVAFPLNRYICWGTPGDYETYKYWQAYFTDNRISRASAK